MRRGPVPVGAKHPHGVRVVERERGAVFLGDLEQVRHVGDVSLHREDAVDDDHDARPDRALTESALEACQVAVVEPLGLTVGQLRAVHDRRVIELVEEHDVAPAHEPGDHAEVRLVAGRKDETGLFPEELGQLGLEPAVQLERPVERSEEHTSELQSPCNLVCRLLLEKKKKPLTPLTVAITHCIVAHRITSSALGDCSIYQLFARSGESIMAIARASSYSCYRSRISVYTPSDTAELRVAREDTPVARPVTFDLIKRAPRNERRELVDGGDAQLVPPSDVASNTVSFFFF